MSGEEERLYARAEMLEDLDEMASAVSDVLAGAQGAGVDPRAVTSLTAALQTLDPGAGAGYSAGSRKDRQDGSGYGSDGEFLEALSDAEDQVRERLREVTELREQVSLALDRAERDLGQARRDLETARAALAAAYAMSTRQPCDGCHSARAAAIAAAEADIADAEAQIADAGRRTGICEAADDILDSPRGTPGPRAHPAADGPPGPRRGLRAGLPIRLFRGETAPVRTLDRRSVHVRPARSPGTHLLRPVPPWRDSRTRVRPDPRRPRHGLPERGPPP